VAQLCSLRTFATDLKFGLNFKAFEKHFQCSKRAGHFAVFFILYAVKILISQMLTSEDIQANNTYHYIQSDLSICEIIFQSDFSNRKVRTNKEISVIFLAWQKENMSGHRSWCRIGSGMQAMVKKRSVRLTLT